LAPNVARRTTGSVIDEATIAGISKRMKDLVRVSNTQYKILSLTRGRALTALALLH
jgi:hypothetical protein